MTKSANHVAVFGDLTLDTTVRVAGFPVDDGATMLEVDGVVDRVGGAAANVACGLRALDNQVSFGSVIGTDRIGDLVLERLADLGVDVRQVRRDWPVTPRTVVLVDREGQRRRIDDPKQAHDYRFPDELLPEVIGDATWVFLPAQAWCRPVARFAREYGCRVVVDLQDLPGDDEYHREFLRHAHAVVFSTGRLGMHSEDFFRRLWREYPVEVAAATHGSGGATLGLRAGTLVEFEPAFDIRPIVDRGGVGDAFTAGFLDAMVRGRSPREALTRGQLAAAYKLGERGSSRSYPRADRLQGLFERFGRPDRQTHSA
jgi:sugar/nucleoside kinase (ribokinase family)